MVVKDRRSSFPIIFALGSLILLILLLGFYFENCLKKELSMVSNQEAVLGVSTFSSSASKNPVNNHETFNFKTTIVGDQAGVLNATVLFDLTGPGVIGSNIQGPGVCVKITDTTGACNNVNIDPNETIVWTVPITAAANCSEQSPASLTLQTRLAATLVTSTSTATANCVANQPSSTTSPTTPATTGNGTTPPSTTGGGNQSGNGATNTTNGSGNNAQGLPVGGSGSAIDIAGFACSRVNGFPLVFILFIIWLILAAYYFIFSRRN